MRTQEDYGKEVLQKYYSANAEYKKYKKETSILEKQNARDAVKIALESDKFAATKVAIPLIPGL